MLTREGLWLVPGACLMIALLLAACLPSVPIQPSFAAGLDEQGRVVVYVADCPDGTPSKVEVFSFPDNDPFQKTLVWSATRVDADGPALDVVVLGVAPDGFETDLVLKQTLEDQTAYSVTFTENDQGQSMGWKRQDLLDAPDGELFRGSDTYVDVKEFPSVSECWWD